MEHDCFRRVVNSPPRLWHQNTSTNPAVWARMQFSPAERRQLRKRRHKSICEAFRDVLSVVPSLKYSCVELFFSCGYVAVGWHRRLGSRSDGWKEISLQLQIMFYLVLCCCSTAPAIIDEGKSSAEQKTFVLHLARIQISWCVFSNEGGC